MFCTQFWEDKIITVRIGDSCPCKYTVRANGGTGEVTDLQRSAPRTGAVEATTFLTCPSGPLHRWHTPRMESCQSCTCLSTVKLAHRCIECTVASVDLVLTRC
jgi:hypothetical protein